ncbi:helix-turn-helix transcriptional regulator [Jhaorihella thermophila]
MRLAAGLTQAELADRIGASRKTINTIENGVFVPSTVLALRIAAVLGCRVEDIFSLPRRSSPRPSRFLTTSCFFLVPNTQIPRPPHATAAKARAFPLAPVPDPASLPRDFAGETNEFRL